MPKFYSKYLTKTLVEAVEEQLNEAPGDQLSLLEELAIMRGIATESMVLHKAASMLPDDADPAKQERKRALIAKGSDAMSSALKDIAAMCKDAAAVSASQSSKFSVHDLRHILKQVVVCAHEAFEPLASLGDGEHEGAVREALELFAESIRSSIKLPGKVAEAEENLHAVNDPTLEMVRSMDATIPDA